MAVASGLRLRDVPKVIGIERAGKIARGPEGDDERGDNQSGGDEVVEKVEETADLKVRTDVRRSANL